MFLAEEVAQLQLANKKHPAIQWTDGNTVVMFSQVVTSNKELNARMNDA